MSDADVTRTASPGSKVGLAQDARFVAGTVLADRYRIVALLGRGGMGEVYRADDLKLRQSVAIKFLPAEIGLQSSALTRFHREARLARQVSHPYVCRVYDVGEIDGLHFLTMEFIDGEDLASLLRRIGRVPSDKALEIARQVCAGLAAAHDAGVIHRDLKPANLMIDSRGRARITDFGIAALATEVRGETIAGTPAYMAPEQRLGDPGTTRSDIYALGLVLYELFTGSRFASTSSALEATTVPDLHPRAAAAILRCLDSDPERRPVSPIYVAAALPGGDPLQAALASGELPSPEMVAASGTPKTLRPAIGLGLFLLVGALLMAGAWLRTQVNIAAQVTFDSPPEVLVFKAREILDALGYTDRAPHSAHGFRYNDPFIFFAQNVGVGRSWLRSDREQALQFWYRESPRPMIPLMHNQGGLQAPRAELVTENNPPLATAGMKLVILDLKGRLVSFRAVPPQFGTNLDANRVEADQVLAAAGVNRLDVNRVDPIWTPPVTTDARTAWTDTHLNDPLGPLRYEIGTLRGALTAFETIGAWQSNEFLTAARPTRSGTAAALVTLVLIVVGAAVAWMNVREGWGDRRGAARLAVLLFGLRLTSWGLNANHVFAAEELTLFRMGLSEAVFDGVSGCVLYLALEPFIRRWWPRVLVGWNRIMSARFRDPRVGYELLVGLLLTTAATAVNLAVIYVTSGATATTNLDGLQSIRGVGAALASDLNEGLFIAVTTAFLVALLRQAFRREWAAVVAVVLVFAVIAKSVEPVGSSWWSGPLMGGSLAIAAIIALTRFGLVALVAFSFAWTFLQQAPALLRPSAWYSGVSFFVFGVMFAIVGWALYSSTASLPTANRIHDGAQQPSR